IEGATIIGSISYPINADEVKALAGKEIEIVGYVTGTSGSDKYLNVLALEVKEAEGTGTVDPVDPTEKTIGEIIASENGEYTVTGIVVAHNAQSFLIKDETGIIMVYCGKTYANDLKVGVKVKVSGSTTEYGKAKQFAAGSTYEIVGAEAVDHGVAQELSAAELDAYATMETITPSYVKVSGVLAVSGTYFNLNIEGTSSVVGSLVYPVDVEALTALNGKELEVYAYLTGLTGTKYLQLVVVEYKEVEGTGTVDPVDPAEKTIGEIIASENGEYITTGLVVGVNAQSFLIKDETGIMLVYNGSSWTKDVEVGDKVKVSGSTTEYGKAKQFGAGSTYEKVGTETVDHGAAKELSAADCDAYASEKTVKPEYVKVKGVLTVSGNYYNVAIEGATITGSISYPINADEVKALAGKEIEIVGYVTGTSGSDKYLNVLALEVKATDGTTPTPTPTPTPNPGPVTAEGIKFDFVSNFDVYGGAWESSYSEKVLSNSDLGVDTKAQFVLSNANRQSQTIMDRPVLASKSSATQYVTVSGWEGTLTQVTFELKQWSGSKKFTK
ncbi:MAG: hypothetical protein IJA65_03480, partial [Acholeplasmatales bacterium]|nr:hypothetical protein [Acholeplasmatales bacterium]